MRIGIGYDVHKFSEGRMLVIGGVSIPYSRGLLGHSDADVLVHAIMDALLGAAGIKDIGHQFPSSDPQYKDISSILLLERVGKMVKSKSYLIQNIDSVVIAEAPVLSPYIDEMRKNIANALDMRDYQVMVKATTTDGLGFTGRGEGIAAQAIAMLNE
jgi:2-C-methyl-D-erythritol 2,4-cyclodiphosphate synthase